MSYIETFTFDRWARLMAEAEALQTVRRDYTRRFGPDVWWALAKEPTATPRDVVAMKIRAMRRELEAAGYELWDICSTLRDPDMTAFTGGMGCYTPGSDPE